MGKEKPRMNADGHGFVRLKANGSEGSAVGSVFPVGVWGFRWAVFGFVAGGNGLCEHLKGFALARQLLIYEVGVMPFIELKPEGQTVRVAGRELFVRGQEEEAVLGQ